MMKQEYQLFTPAHVILFVTSAIVLGGCAVRDVGPFKGGWEVDRQAVEEWRPGTSDPQSEPGLVWTSRLWASPNPLLLPLPMGDGPTCGGVLFQSIGPDRIHVTSARYEGYPLEGDGLHDLMLPIGFHDGSNGAGGGWSTILCAQLMSLPGFLGELILTTDDPVAGEVRVAVVGVPHDEIPYDPVDGGQFDMPPVHSRLHFSVNPLRVVHADGERQILVKALRLGGEPMNLRGIGTIGPDASVASVEIHGNGAWDGAYPVALRPSRMGDGTLVEIHITVRYTPTSVEPRDDALMVAFDDGGLEAYRVAVPIVIR